MISAQAWHNHNIILCVSSNDEAVNDDDFYDEFKFLVKYPPVITMKERLIVVDEGSNFTITCLYHSFPKTLTNIQIYHDYKEKVIDFVDTGDSVKVHFSNVTKRHEGVYSCVLANDIGQGRPAEPTKISVVTRPVVRISIAGIDLISLIPYQLE